jgi:hypothetical protein
LTKLFIQIVDRLLRVFEKRIEAAGIADNFGRIDDDAAIESKSKVGDGSFVDFLIVDS